MHFSILYGRYEFGLIQATERTAEAVRDGSGQPEDGGKERHDQPGRSVEAEGEREFHSGVLPSSFQGQPPTRSFTHAPRSASSRRFWG